jgi:hypothetical protein
MRDALSASMSSLSRVSKKFLKRVVLIDFRFQGYLLGAELVLIVKDDLVLLLDEVLLLDHFL